jgi:REP element-mobilizing transposase RayT
MLGTTTGFIWKNSPSSPVRFGCTVRAYVLMTDHVRLLLTPEKADSVGLLMKHLGQRDAQYVNDAYGRSGTICMHRQRSWRTSRAECDNFVSIADERARWAAVPDKADEAKFNKQL